jgi:multidrug efflux pump subunit AcrB
MMVQDRSGAGYKALEQAPTACLGAATRRRPHDGGVLRLQHRRAAHDRDVDREKALMLGVQPADVYSTMGAYLGSTYVNDFNMLGRTFRVTAQAEQSARDDVSDIANLKVARFRAAWCRLDPSRRSRTIRARCAWCASTCSPPPRFRALPRRAFHPAKR